MKKAYILVTAEAIIDIARKYSDRKIPEDAEVRGVYFDNERDTFKIQFRSDSLPWDYDTPEGCMSFQFGFAGKAQCK